MTLREQESRDGELQECNTHNTTRRGQGHDNDRKVVTDQISSHDTRAEYNVYTTIKPRPVDQSVFKDGNVASDSVEALKQ